MLLVHGTFILEVFKAGIHLQWKRKHKQKDVTRTINISTSEHTKAGATAFLYTVRSAFVNFQGLVRFGCIHHHRRRLSLLNIENWAACSPSPSCFDHCWLHWHRLKGVRVRPSTCKGWVRAWSWATVAQNGILSDFPNSSPVTHLDSLEERCTVTGKWLAQEHNTKTTVSSHTRASRSGSNTHLTSPLFPFIGHSEENKKVPCMVLLLYWTNHWACVDKHTLLPILPCSLTAQKWPPDPQWSAGKTGVMNFPT